jgi:DNA ligase (NAD+)
MKGIKVMKKEEQEMQLLIKKLNDASKNYYGGGVELMSDHEWDKAFDKLKKLEEETGIIFPNSPTRNVSNEQGNDEAKHEFPALSLAKTKKIEDLVKWADNRPIWLSWKLDGLTLVATYDDGEITSLVTRGNGYVGKDVTDLASGIFGVPCNINDTGHLVVRGEAVIKYEDFENYKLMTGEFYANPRNLAAGSMSAIDGFDIMDRHIQFIPFTLVYTDKDIQSWGLRMEYLKALGFNVVDHELIDIPSLENVSSVVERWSSIVSSGKNPFPVDGLVIAYDDTDYAMTGNVTGHHAIRAGFAFKWQDEEMETTLRNIEWSCGIQTITPIAVFDPIELEGTKVRRASLCNLSECDRLGIGGNGTIIKVIKANKIIPKVVGVTKKVGSMIVPAKCPVCGHDTMIDISRTGTRSLKCTNVWCTAKQLRKFVRFVSPCAMDIDGLAESTLSVFINQGWLKELPDVFSLMDHAEEMVKLDGFGVKKAMNLRKAIEKARDVSDESFIFSLSISLIGIDVARKLLRVYYPLEKLFNIARNASNPFIFADIPGIGNEKSIRFVNWCQDQKNWDMYKRLLGCVRIIDLKASREINENGECARRTFVITGNIENWPNRDALKRYIIKEGGLVSSSVSKTTDYLINNDINSTSAKNRKAKALNIPIISEIEFIEKFGC